MKVSAPPFYPDEIITGHVSSLHHGYAVIKVSDWHLPLENTFISWDLIDQARDVLATDQRIQAVVHTERDGIQNYRRSYQCPKRFWQGYWLNRLPLLESPEDRFKIAYPSGSIIAVEFLAYINFYTAKAKMPDGTVIELLQRDIHPSETLYGVSLYAHQPITLRVKSFKGRTLLGKRLE